MESEVEVEGWGGREGCVRRRYIKRQIHQIGEEHQNDTSNGRYISHFTQQRYSYIKNANPAKPITHAMLAK